MRVIAFAFLFFIFLSSSALADIYRWTDDEGVIHMADDMFKVPEKYRSGVTIMKTEPSAPAPPSQIQPSLSPPSPPAEPPRAEEELYGDRPLSWWRANIDKKKKEIESVESEFKQKRQFVEVFEKGRQFGQIFEPKDAETYEQYKKDLPEAEKKVEKLKEELDELKNKARRAGVPKAVRGE